MKADIIVIKDASVYRIERGRAVAEIEMADRPRLKVRFNGGAVQISLTPEEAYRLGAELIVCADYHIEKQEGNPKTRKN